MNPETNKKTLLKWLTEFPILDDEAREKLFDESFAGNTVLIQGTERLDKAGHLGMIKGFEAGFDPNTNKGWETEMHDIIAQGNTVAALYTIHATQTNEFAGVASTGKRVPFKCQFHAFFNEEGKIGDVHFKMDMESAMAILTTE
jgi:predicted ester cyclase